MVAGYLGSLNSFHSFRENKNGAAGAPSGRVDAPPRGPVEMFTVWKNSHLRGSQQGS